jgi:diadenosine tetraphosphate (Ap4A) HIT family hydrolase
MTGMIDLEQAQRQGVAPWDDVVWEDFHIVVYRDRYPVALGHLLFVPRYNGVGMINEAVYSAIAHGNKMVDKGECDGFNIGINFGEAAGQTVMYPHVHLIPRRHGDCADPVGGVRGVIAGQANYKKDGYKTPNGHGI